MKLKSNINLKQFLQILGLAWFIGNSIVLNCTFFTAFWNGIKTGSYEVIVTINDFNEAIPEAIMMPVVFVIGVYAVFTVIKEILLELFIE